MLHVKEKGRIVGTWALQGQVFVLGGMGPCTLHVGIVGQIEFTLI